MCPGQGDAPCSPGCLWAVAIRFKISTQTAHPLLPWPKGATGKGCELQAVPPVWHKPSLPQHLHSLHQTLPAQTSEARGHSPCSLLERASIQHTLGAFKVVYDQYANCPWHRSGINFQLGNPQGVSQGQYPTIQGNSTVEPVGLMLPRAWGCSCTSCLDPYGQS